jgi:hypothetical protein
MHEKHVDSLTRVIAQCSRRDCLRALVTALIMPLLTRPRAAASQLEGTIVPGGACAASEECRPTMCRDSHRSASCADNGFASDGPLNCCSGSSDPCYSDEDCCGDLRCGWQGELCSTCGYPPFPTRWVGQLCVADADCIAPLAASLSVACIQERCVCLGPEEQCVLSGGEGLPDVPETESALSVAEELSRLAVERRFEALYERMHPDAKEIIPREAVVGWYQEHYAPRGAEVAQPIKVRIAPWTWAITGKAYLETADVAYRQRFAGGTEERDEAHLVKDWNGNWSWFFGRDRAFVEEQIARFDGSTATPGTARASAVV